MTHFCFYPRLQQEKYFFFLQDKLADKILGLVAGFISFISEKLMSKNTTFLKHGAAFV